MILRRQHKSNRFTGPKLILVVALLVGMVLVADRVFNVPIGNTARQSVAAALGAARSVSDTVGDWRLFSTRSALLEQLAEAEAQAEKAGAYYAEYKLLRAEFDALWQTRGATTSTSTVVTSARVLSTSASSPYGTFIIAAGYNQGVQAGDIAAVSTQTAVGTVTEVDANTSLVTLFSAPGATHEVLIGSGASTTPAELVGRGNGNFESGVLRGAPIAVGDVAALRNGYAIALVGRVNMSPEDAARHVLLRVPVNLETVRIVAIMRTPTPPANAASSATRE